MSGYDFTLAQRLDSAANTVAGAAAEIMIVAASRLRQLANLPDHVLPPPPVVPTRLAPMPAIDHVLESVDGLDDGFHDVGKLTGNAVLPRPGEAAVPKRRIFEDPRLKEGYKPPKKIK